MTFKFKYQDVVRKPNPMVTINPLQRGSGKTVTLQDRVDKLTSNHHWKKTMKAWRELNAQLDVTRLPKVSMEKLGVLLIDEDIQRELDEKHCANKIANPEVFDPALLQTLQCIKTTDGRFISIDGQHTSTTIAALISAGCMEGVTDWKEFEFPFQYIETDNLAYARKAFGILNGKGKRRQSQYQQLRNSVFVVRIDKDTTDDDDVKVEAKVSIAESHNCFPVEDSSSLLKYPGTFSNISIFKRLHDHEIEAACSWHDKYFHYEGVHVSLFFIFGDLCRAFNAAKIPMTTSMLEDFAALIQTLFGNLSQYQTSIAAAHREWCDQRHGYQSAWDDDAYVCALVQLYKKFGGTEKIPPSLFDNYDGIIDFLDADILSLAD